MLGNKARIIILSTAAIIAIILAGTCLLRSDRGQEVFARFEQTLTREVSDTLGTKITIGQLELDGLTTAIIHDITIFSNDGEVMASVEELSASYSIFSFLIDQEPVTMIKEVRLKNPRLFLRQISDDYWNIEDLKMKKKDGSADFTGKVIIENGDVEIVTILEKWGLKNLSGQADCAKWPAIKVDLTFAHQEGEAEVKSQVKGIVNTENKQMQLSAKVPQVYLPKYQKLLPADIPVLINDGKIIDINVEFQKKDDKMEYKGQFKIDDARAEIKGAKLLDGLKINDIEIDKVRAWVTFNNGEIYILDALISAFSQQLSLKGQVGLNSENPALQLLIESQGVDLGRFFSKDILPVEGPVAFRASLGGTFKEPVVEGRVKWNDGKYENISFANASAGIDYRAKSLKIKEAVAETLGGKINLTGELNVENKEYSMRLTGEDLILDEFAAQAGIERISGAAQVVLAAKGNLEDLKSSEIEGRIAAASGKVSGVSFKNFYGAVGGRGNLLKVKQAGAVIGETGFVNAVGEIENGKLNLTLEGRQIQLGLLQVADIQKYKAAGIISFDGKLTGDVTYPQADISFKTQNCQVKGLDYGEAWGNLKITKYNLDIEEIIVKENTGYHQVKGDINLASAVPGINVTIATNKIRAESIAPFLPPEHKLTGYFDQETVITGSLDKFDAKGWIKLSGGSYNGYLIDEVKGDYEYKDKKLYVDDLTIRSLGSKIFLIGWLDSDENVNFSYQASEINLARMPIAYPYPVTGWINIVGQIKGKINDPLIEGKMNASRIRANGQILSGLTGDFNYNRDIVNIGNLSVRHGTGQFYFYGKANIKTMEVDGRLKVENAGIPGLLELAKQSKVDIDGFLNGDISLAGTVDKPAVTVLGEIKDGRIKQYPLGSIEMNASFVNNVIKVRSLKAEQDDAILAAQGEIDLDGDVDMEISGKKIGASMLTALLESGFDPPGKVTFTIQASGSAKNPDVAVSLEVDGKGEKDAGVDNLYGLFNINDGIISINNLYVEKGPYKASAQGVLPLKALNVSGRKEADNTDEMNITLKLDNADLTILPLLFKEVKSASGQTTGQIVLTGTLASPKANGQIKIVDNAGTLKLADFADPIEKIGVDIIFKDDTINIDKFYGEMRGGYCSLTGTAAIKGLGLSEYNLSLVVDKIRARHKYFDGLINAKLSLTDKGENGRALLSGDISTENSMIDIPSFSESSPSDLNAELDVDVNIGRKVRLYNPYLFDLAIGGKVKIGGTLKDPKLSGHVESRKGSIIYLTTRFNVINASADFVSHKGFIPNISLEAKTKVGRTLVMLDVGGTATDIQLKLSSDPPASHENIIKLLTFGVDADNNNGFEPNSRGSANISNLLAVGLQIQAVSQVEGILRSIAGIDEFRIEPMSMFDYRSRKATNNTNSEYYGYSLKVSKYLTDSLMLSSCTALDQTSNSIIIQYDVNKYVNLSGTFGGLTHGLYTIESRFRF